MLEIKLNDAENSARIVVVGIGGAGNNAVNRMNTVMYESAAVQENLRKLKKFGFSVIEPSSGHLACGVTGKGKMPEPEVLFSFIEHESPYAEGKREGRRKACQRNAGFHSEVKGRVS